MGFDDHPCNTGLVLGLGLTTSSPQESTSPPKAHNPSRFANKPSPNSAPTSATFEPSLTLGLPGEPYHQLVASNYKGGGNSHEEAIDLYRQASSPHSHSAVSSFSSGRVVKRERDLSSEEVEVEKVSSRVSDEDEDGSNARKKLRLTKEQSALLEESFKQHSTLNPVSSLSLSPFLSLHVIFVYVWNLIFAFMKTNVNFVGFNYRSKSKL